MPSWYWFVGLDLIDGKPMWVYQYSTAVDLTGTKVATTTKVWLGVLDRLLYKQESESDSPQQPGAKTRRISTWEYDPNLKIEAPIQ